MSPLFTASQRVYASSIDGVIGCPGLAIPASCIASFSDSPSVRWTCCSSCAAWFRSIASVRAVSASTIDSGGTGFCSVSDVPEFFYRVLLRRP